MRVKVKRDVWKQLSKLPEDISMEAMAKIVDLRHNPYPRGFDKVEGEKQTFRLWIRKDYRLLYSIDKSENCVKVLNIARKSKRTYK